MLKKRKKGPLYTVDERCVEKSREKIKNEGKVREHQVNTKKKERKNKTKQNSRKAHQIDGYFSIDKRNTL